MILPYSKWPVYDQILIRGISKIISSGKVNYLFGKYGREFEEKFSNFHKIKYSVAVSNGTVGLELALASFNFKKDDEVLVTPRSYYSSASCIIRNNLKPIFVDIDPSTQNICIKDIKRKFTRRTKCIICVHLGGLPCDMNNIIHFAKKNNIKVIEDCSQAHGASIKKKYVGTFGDIGVWSFCNDKIISTLGEGGMVSTNNKKLFEKIWALKDIGKNYRKFINKDKNNYKFRWLHDSIGTNARMTEIQAYAGIYQLRNLNKFIHLRKKNSEYIFNQLKSIPCLKFLKTPSNTKNVYYRFNFLFDETYNSKKLSRDIILKDMSKKINIREGSCPEIYNEKYFKENFNFNCPNAKYIGKNSLSLQVDHTINKKNLIKMTNLLKNYLENKL